MKRFFYPVILICAIVIAGIIYLVIIPGCQIRNETEIEHALSYDLESPHDRLVILKSMYEESINRNTFTDASEETIANSKLMVLILRAIREEQKHMNSQ